MMNRILLTIMFWVAAVAGVFASDGGPHIEFAEKTHDFGTIHESNGRVSTSFEFTNTGDKPLVIVTAYASCGCTKPKYPEAPIAPGQKGEISVTYNPANRRGEFSSTVTVTTNDKKNKKIKLKLTGVIVP